MMGKLKEVVQILMDVEKIEHGKYVPKQQEIVIKVFVISRIAFALEAEVRHRQKA